MEHYFTGTIDRIIYENASNFFKILLLSIEDTDSDIDDFEIIITGTMADVFEGEDYTFWGELTQHPKYGQQVKLTRYQKAKPTSSGLIKYFSSDHFKGIGKKTAEKIVTLYGDNTIDKILEDPSQLETITGFSKANREAFLATLKLNYGTEQIISSLVELGISNRLAFLIYDCYKEEALETVKTNPYQLVEDIQGIGFKMADTLAYEIGINSDAPERFRAALLHSLLEKSISQGDTYIEARDLLEYAINLLEDSRPIECQPAQVAEQLSQLIADSKIYHIGTKLFDATLYASEAGIHKHISRLLETPLSQPHSEESIDEEIQSIEASFNMTYDRIQKEAIKLALSSKVFILTGGPGTGKTTVIRGILEAYSSLNKIDLEKKDFPILLAAPTGRAARRMNELTGLPSATIHRHLGLNGDNDYQAMDDYLDCDLIIIDEFSMVDTWLANQLLSSLPSSTQVIIVGDSDQLPSVGPGQVLADLLKVPSIPKIALQKIFRQSEDSTIVDLANQMRLGHLPSDFKEKKADRSFFEAYAQHIPTMVTKIVTSAINSGIPKEEIQILAPMYKGQAGINHLNQLMQDLLNPLGDGQEFLFNDLHLRKGDKILHLVNDAQLNVFNGDIGYISDLIPAKYTESKQDEIIMDFDGTEVTYPRNEWLKITLAYVMSIHKSQGSEFQVVILPITHQGGRLLQRNLIYTAVTRSKSKLILLGEYSAFHYAIQKEGDKRQTYLVQRFADSSLTETPDNDSGDDHLQNAQLSPQKITNDVQYLPIKDSDPQEEESYRLTLENMLSIDPMIGLKEEDILIFFNKN
ncbi:SF1B family DNA helicase RecD2 [Streptococcus uberis]